MVYSHSALRLKQLEDNISHVLQLLNEYEKELLDEDDPSRISRYRRRVETLRQQKKKYEEEFLDLQDKLKSKYPNRIQSLSSQIQNIDNKIDSFLEGQVGLSQELMLHFSSEVQCLILPLAQKLNQSEIVKSKKLLESIDKNLVPEESMRLILSEISQAIKISQDEKLHLPEESEIVAEIINSPEIDAKHALKVSIPIIPFVLAYEGELGLGTGINLKEFWTNLRSKFIKDS